MTSVAQRNKISESDGLYHGRRSDDFSLDSSLHSGECFACLLSLILIMILYFQAFDLVLCVDDEVNLDLKTQ